MSTKNEKGEIVFDEEEQAVVNRVVQDRVARVKAEKPADYDELTELNKALDTLYPGMTPKQRSAMIAKQIKDRNELRERQDAEERARRRGTDPDDELENQRRDREIAELKARQQAKDKEEADRAAAEKQARETKAAQDKMLDEFHEKYPDVDMEKLDQDPRFIKFAKGKQGQHLIEVYEDFLEVSGAADTERFMKARDKEERSTGGEKGGHGGNDYGLTPDQKKTLADWNRKNPQDAMTEKEYASRL